MQEEREDPPNVKDLMYQLRYLVNYWNSQSDRNQKEKLEGLVHSILCILDGVSGSFDGDINDIAKMEMDGMLHDEFYEKR